MSNSNVLFILTGSIACFKACELISMLVKKGHQVQCVATDSALQFVGKATLEGLTGQSVATHTFDEHHMMDHIYLARKADKVIVCPATANTLNKWAHGISNDLASNLFLAFDRPQDFYIVPAMNTKMYQHPCTQDSIKTLQGYGYQVLDTQSGDLACGEYGAGRMLEPEHIYQQIFTAPTKRGKVLITAGGTSEPIDGVRFITNTSTGKTAHKLAQFLQSQNYEVIFLRAKSAPVLDQATNIEFTSFASLQTSLFDLLQKHSFEFIYHAAAVSDYSVSFVNSQPANSNMKLDSQNDQLDLSLTKNPKLIHKIKTFSPNSTLIGFKLTKTPVSSERIQAVEKLMPYVDYVVHNDMLDIEAGQHVFNLYSKDLKLLAKDLGSITEVPHFVKQSNQEKMHDLMS